MTGDPDTPTIQLSVRIADTAFDIILEGNNYNPTVIDDAIAKMRDLIGVSLPQVITHGYGFPLHDDPDDGDDE